MTKLSRRIIFVDYKRFPMTQPEMSPRNGAQQQLLPTLPPQQHHRYIHTGSPTNAHTKPPKNPKTQQQKQKHRVRDRFSNGVRPTQSSHSFWKGKNGKKRRRKKSQDPTTTITMLLIFLEGEKTSQQQQQQVQKRKRRCVCVCVCGAKGITTWGLGGCFLFIIVVPTRHVLQWRTQREREREGGRARARDIIATTNVSFGVGLSRRQCSLGNDKKQTPKQIELNLRWGWWVGR